MNAAAAVRSHRGPLIVGAVLVVLAVALGVMVHLQATAKADGRKDARCKAGTTAIRTAIFSYAKAHDHNLPQPDQVTAAGLSSYLPAGASWPVNPFTGKPMQAGPGPGDFQYRRSNDHVYTIDCAGTDGKSVW